jgi:hypothetical protein
MQRTLRNETKISLTWVKERESTCIGDCRHVSGSVQKYRVQYKGYKLIGVTIVEGGAREVRQHWFITGYIAAYIQGTVHCVQEC